MTALRATVVFGLGLIMRWRAVGRLIVTQWRLSLTNRGRR
jgi:hypothetical protein